MGNARRITVSRQFSGSNQDRHAASFFDFGAILHDEQVKKKFLFRFLITFSPLS